MERDQWRQETVALRQEIRDLSGRDSLAKMKIATLTAQVDAYSKASAVIIWDAEKQRGVVKFVNVPRPESGKDYQLWVIDPKYPQPVNGGLVPVDAEGFARVSFTPDQPVSKVDKFAISVEPAGGVPKATGPIVLLGGN
jgi:anti-sigma-K factor RskA